MTNRVFAGLMLVVAAWVSTALAEADGPDYYAVTNVVATDVLNLRAGPSARAEKIGEIPHNARHLRSLGCQGMPSFAEWKKMTPEQRVQSNRRYWCRIEYQGAEGWVAGRYLREDSAGLPTVRE